MEERDSAISDLRSLLERRNQELDGLEQLVATTQWERTRLQLHSNEMTMSLVANRQELEESRVVATAARAYEEAGRQQLAHMIDEQLAQIQTMETLRRQVETSDNAVREAQALLRMNQDQQQQHLRMPPPSNLSTISGGITTLCNSIVRDAHKRVARSGLLPCGFTARPRICGADESNVW